VKKNAKEHTPESLDTMEAEIGLQLAVVTRRREALTEEGFDPKLASTTAALAKALTQIHAERRLREKDRNEPLTSKSIEEIASYLRTLPEPDRQWVADEIMGIHDDEPLL
jgi:hypothetical protein